MGRRGSPPKASTSMDLEEEGGREGGREGGVGSVSGSHKGMRENEQCEKS